MAMKPRVIFIALEPARLAIDPYNHYKNKNYATNYGSMIEGNMDYQESLGVCALVMKDITKGDYEVFTEETMQSATRRLRSADLVVGFNLCNYELELLKPYANYALQRLPIFDIQAEIKYLISKRDGVRLPIDQDKIPLISLANVAKQTIDRQFTMFADMPLLWADGKQKRVIEYITERVDAIQGIFNHGCRQGAISYFIYKSKGPDILPTPLWKHKARSIVESEIPTNYVDGQTLMNDIYDDFIFKPAPEYMFALPNPMAGIKKQKEILANNEKHIGVLHKNPVEKKKGKLIFGEGIARQLVMDFS